MKTLIVHKNENIGGVELKQGTYSGEQLVDADVHLRDIANLVARGRAEWSHETPVEKQSEKAGSKVAAKSKDKPVVPIAVAVAKRQAPGDE